LSTAPQRTTAGIATGRVLGMMAEVEIIAYASTVMMTGASTCVWQMVPIGILYLVLLFMAITASSSIAANTVNWNDRNTYT